MLNDLQKKICKMICKIRFAKDDLQKMIRFEMSEYVNLSGGERLIGGQPGGESLLNCWVRQSPFQSCWMRNLERLNARSLICCYWFGEKSVCSIHAVGSRIFANWNLANANSENCYPAWGRDSFTTCVLSNLIQSPPVLSCFSFGTILGTLSL